MHVVCLPSVEDLGEISSPALIVLPEGISMTDLGKAQDFYPDAVVVAGVAEAIAPCRDSNACSKARPCIGIRGVVAAGGREFVGYRKVETDGRTCGFGSPPNVNPVCHFDELDLVVGVLVCIDVQAEGGAFQRRVIEELRGSQARWKVLCIPADMGNYWYPNLGAELAGVHVLLSNRTDGFHRNGGRRLSFIAADRVFLKKQEGCEAIETTLL